MRVPNERSIQRSQPSLSSKLVLCMWAPIRFYSAGVNKSSASRLYPDHEDVRAGGLVSYGNSVTEAYRHAGLYVGRILRGAKPSDLPVKRLTKFQFVINLTTSKTLGLTIPASFLSLADELIE